MKTEVGSLAWAEAAGPSITATENGNHLDGQLEVMVRPDCLECFPSPGGQGRIIDREFRGSFYLYRISLPSGHSVRCLLSHIDELPVGTTVSVGLREGHTLRPFVDGVAVSGR